MGAGAARCATRPKSRILRGTGCAIARIAAALRGRRRWPGWRCRKDSFAVIQGEATRWDGNGGAERYFCGACGTSLYYFNDAVLPGIADIQSATLDDAGAYEPAAQIQCAERLGYMAKLDEIPAFERWPG